MNIAQTSQVVRQIVASIAPQVAPKLHHNLLGNAVAKDLASAANGPFAVKAKAGWRTVAYVLPVLKSNGVWSGARYAIGAQIFALFGNSGSAQSYHAKAMTAQSERNTVASRISARVARRRQ